MIERIFTIDNRNTISNFAGEFYETQIKHLMRYGKRKT